MHRFSVNNSSTYGCAITEWPGLRHRHRPILRHARNQNIPIDASDQAICCVTQPRGTLDYRVEHRLNIGRRAGDHAPALASRVCCSKASASSPSLDSSFSVTWRNPSLSWLSSVACGLVFLSPALSHLIGVLLNPF